MRYDICSHGWGGGWGGGNRGWGGYNRGWGWGWGK